MAFNHHYHHHHHATAAYSASCCCGCSRQPPAPAPSISADPLVVASIVSHLLQTPAQTPLHHHDFYSQTLKPAKINPNRRQPHRETDQFQHSHPGFFNLLQRIDALEAAFQRFSCSSSFSLRDAAARTIQSHFRSYLVRRSRALGQLKYLASIKSSVVSLKSSLSRRGFVDFESLSSRAMALLREVDSIQGDYQMISDSKRSIINEIAQFLDLLDGVCVKRHQVKFKTIRNMRSVRNDDKSVPEHDREFSDPGTRSARRNVSNEEKKLLENLKERVVRIGRFSRELEDEEEEDALEQMEELNHDVLGEVDGDIASNSTIYRVESGSSAKKHVVHPNGKKHVSFMEEGNVVRVYDDEGT